MIEQEANRMVNPIRMCRNCYWVSTELSIPTCENPKATEPVGAGVIACKFVRECYGKCGPDGSLWKPKPIKRPWWRFWK